MLLRAWRWMLCFEEDHSISILDSLAAYSLGSLSTFVIPARLGDLVRVYVVGQAGSVSKIRAIGTLVVERLSDLIAVVLFISAMLPLFPLPQWVVSADILAAVIGLVALVVVYILARQSERLVLPAWVSRRSALERIGQWVLQLLGGLAAVKDGKRVAGILLLSFVVWLLTIASYAASFQALGLPLGWREGALLTCVLALVAIVPAGPGFVGSFELAAVAVLGLFAIDRSVTIGYVEYTRIAALISYMLMTAFSFAALRLRDRRLHRAVSMPVMDSVVPAEQASSR